MVTKLLSGESLCCVYVVCVIEYMHNVLAVAAADPVFTEHPVDVMVDQGEEFNLSCSARGNPTPMVIWYKDDTLFFLMEPVDGVLIFSGATEEDAGVYECRARKPSSNPPVFVFSQSAIVDVTCKYSIHSKLI